MLLAELWEVRFRRVGASSLGQLQCVELPLNASANFKEQEPTDGTPPLDCTDNEYLGTSYLVSLG